MPRQIHRCPFRRIAKTDEGIQLDLPFGDVGIATDEGIIHFAGMNEPFKDAGFGKVIEILLKKAGQP